jgi:hypothetical protein
MLALVAVIGIALCASSLLRAATDEKPKASADEIKKLIVQLHSPNKPRLLPFSETPSDFDATAQKRVAEAVAKLRAIGFAAFPYLIEHFDDNSYCISGDTGCSGMNTTVGNICFFIFKSNLIPYGTQAETTEEVRHVARRPIYTTALKLDEPKAAQAWWKAHQKKSLHDLQLEVLKWTMDEEAKHPDDFTDDERVRLETELERLQKSDKALEPTWWIFEE